MGQLHLRRRQDAQPAVSPLARKISVPTIFKKLRVISKGAMCQRSSEEKKRLLEESEIRPRRISTGAKPNGLVGLLKRLHFGW